MLKPIHRFIVLVIAGWMNRQQQDAIEYLKQEDLVLREKLGLRWIAIYPARRVDDLDRNS